MTVMMMAAMIFAVITTMFFASFAAVAMGSVSMAIMPEAGDRLGEADLQQFDIIRGKLAAASVGEVVVVDNQQGLGVENQQVLDRDVRECKYSLAITVQVIRIDDIHQVHQFGLLKQLTAGGIADIDHEY